MTLITGGGVLNKISLIVSIEAMVLLYLIGFIANIDFLVFKISPSRYRDCSLANRSWVINSIY